MSRAGGSKSLKDQYRLQLCLVITANAIVFYGTSRWDAIAGAEWMQLFQSAPNLLPAAFAFIVTTIANGILSASMKARLVFLRWYHALPGHQAFSKHALSDPRIDMTRLKKSLGNRLPEGPEAENKAWYRIYKEVGAAPEVQSVHREFLFARDYAGLSALFVVGLGATALATFPTWKVALLFCLALLAQFVVVRHAAALYGARFVCTVLALKSAQLSSNSKL